MRIKDAIVTLKLFEDRIVVNLIKKVIKLHLLSEKNILSE